MPKKILIICGPTASGKSYLGHYLANIYKGEIINCDSMQIYNQIPIITASPSQAYKSEINYHLYNFLPIDQEFSVIKYLDFTVNKIKEISNKKKLPILIGGTGLYINSLIFGYNKIPVISPHIQQYSKTLHNIIGQTEFYNQLKNLDPLIESKINIKDIQRTLRAYNVLKQTKQSIFSFHKRSNIIPLSEFNFQIIFLHPERTFLYHTCNQRLEKIFYEGGIDEINSIKNDLLNISTSAIKAIGITEILAYLNKHITLSEAIERAQIKTRKYAKRQITWFTHQIKEKMTLQYTNDQEFKQLITNMKKSIDL